MAKKSFCFLFLALFTAILPLKATDSLTVAQCRQLALENSPMQQKKLHASSILALQNRNLQSNLLPRIQAGAQASWQSDVFGLPFNFPGSEIPQVPQDQYKITLEAAQKIWDGGADNYQRRQRSLEKDLATAQADVEVFSIRELVTDLFFKALLLQESEAILDATRSDLLLRLKQTEAAVQEGVALRTAADQIRIQILKIEQQQAAARADREALMAILAEWLGRDERSFVLKMAPETTSIQEPARPEYRLFDLQAQTFQTGKEALKVRTLPRFEAFAQGGLGSPNPFNFFETGMEPFLLIGLRAAWTPIDWGNKRREAQIFDYQIKNVEVQRQFFEQRLNASTLKDRQDEQKWQAQLAQDDAIITLQSDIIRRADAQVKNGVMTMTDYLSQLNILTQAQLNRKTHEIQSVQAREMRLAKSGS